MTHSQNPLRGPLSDLVDKTWYLLAGLEGNDSLDAYDKERLRSVSKQIERAKRALVPEAMMDDSVLLTIDPLIGYEELCVFSVDYTLYDSAGQALVTKENTLIIAADFNDAVDTIRALSETSWGNGEGPQVTVKIVEITRLAEVGRVDDVTPHVLARLLMSGDHWSDDGE